MLKFPVYLDYNATTPCDPRVVEAMLPFFSGHFGNAASRSHSFGWQAEEAVKMAREEIAALVGADPTEIIFTSGATEADNLALKGVFETYGSKGKHIITVATEHNAVLDTCNHIIKLGGEVTFLRVKPDGLIDLAELEAAIRPDTILVSVMYANNETGVIQPVKEISRIVRNKGMMFFSDATQAVGKISVNVNEDGIDLMAFTAHKMYGPKGIGALYVRRRNPRVKITAQMDGGGHERGFRSGTLNVPGIVGFGTACRLCREEMNHESQRLRFLRDKMEAALLQSADVVVNGNLLNRMPHVSNICFRQFDGEALIMSFNKEIAVSSGSACTSASLEPSHVLKAMGLSDDAARSSIRFSLGRFTTEEDVDFTITKVMQSVYALRETINFEI